MLYTEKVDIKYIVWDILPLKLNFLSKQKMLRHKNLELVLTANFWPMVLLDAHYFLLKY
jgi:hypothetical protein